MPTVFSKLMPLDAGGAFVSSPTDVRAGGGAGAASATSGTELAGAGGGGLGGRSHAASAIASAQLPQSSHRVWRRAPGMSFAQASGNDPKTLRYLVLRLMASSAVTTGRSVRCALSST